MVTHGSLRVDGFFLYKGSFSFTSLIVLLKQHEISHSIEAGMLLQILYNRNSHHDIYFYLNRFHFWSQVTLSLMEETQNTEIQL